MLIIAAHGGRAGLISAITRKAEAKGRSGERAASVAATRADKV